MKPTIITIISVLCSLALSTICNAGNAAHAPESSIVWSAGEDGINVYTIPGLLVTKSGVVIAYSEARERRGDGGKVDVVIKRSLDGGRTWSQNYFIERAPGRENYVLATLVQDRVSGRVYFFAALRDEGLTDKTTTNTYRYSNDDGATWSESYDITDTLYKADKKIQSALREGRASSEFDGDDPELFGRNLIFFGPGKSIQLSENHPEYPNRLVVPLFYIKDRTITPRGKRGYGNAVLISDDGGVNWSVPGTVPLGAYGSAEASIVELDDGRLMLNCRGAPPESSGMTVAGRTVSYSSNGGATWTRPKPDTSGIPNYIETSSGLLRLPHKSTNSNKTSRILFCFPHSLPPENTVILRGLHKLRANGTVLLSYDEGKSWPVRKLVVPGSFGYSNMDALTDDTVLMIHENAIGTIVSMTRFTLDWLTDRHDVAIDSQDLPLDPVSEVKAINARRLSALVTGDLATLREIYHPECLYTHGSGRIQTGEDHLALLERADLQYLSVRYEMQPFVNIHANDTAVVSGRLHLTTKGHGKPNDRIMATTAVYKKGDSGWKLISYQSTAAPAGPAFKVLSQKPVIENVCAWPKLSLLPNGTIIAALYNQPSHGKMPGDVACWASNDGGLSWEHRGNATKHEGNRAWFNHALGVANNGDLLIATSGWDYKTTSGSKFDKPLVPIVVRSIDKGVTSKVVAEFPKAPEDGKAFIPFGNIEQGDDGLLRVAAYSFARGLPGPRKDTGYVISSTDDGGSWEIESVIGQPEVNETDLLYAGNNRWLAAARNLNQLNGKKAHSMDLYVSNDNAKSWFRHSQLTLPNQHPGDLLKLADGSILLTYGDRRGPDYGVNAKLSDNGGLSWSPEFQIAGGLSSRDSGYPSSVQLFDGTIVTAYYAKGALGHDGYHMGVVRWRLK